MKVKVTVLSYFFRSFHEWLVYYFENGKMHSTAERAFI